MERLIESAVKAIGSIFALGMFGVFVKSLLLTLAALTGFIILAVWVAGMLSGYVTDPALAAWLPALSGFGATLFAYALFPGIMPVFVNFFDSKIASLIERQDYPDARPIDPPFWPELSHDARFSLMAIGLNILVLPLYLIPLVNIGVFYALNGHLLGKEFFVMVARRYLPIPEALALRKRHGRMVFAGGVMLTLLATIPFLNLLAPFWGIALMTHLYHSLSEVPILRDAQHQRRIP